MGAQWLLVAWPPGAMWRDGAIRLQHARLFFPTIANLKAARSLALDDNLAVRRAQFDLADVTA